MPNVCRPFDTHARREILSIQTRDADQELKKEVEAFWQAASCGEVYMDGSSLGDRLEAQAAARYELEPYIFDFAKFSDGKAKKVLEIGVGMGADHLQWANASPSHLIGIDLTQRALGFTHARFLLNNLDARLANADAECLPFRDEEFDIVYSWGVIHHSPDTPTAVREIRRVLRKGGVARVMIYHSRSVVGFLLWLRYGLFRAKPWLSLKHIYAQYLESPGTKAYSMTDARALFGGFSNVRMQVVLSAGDLLEGEAGQRHKGRLLIFARSIWPRSVLRRFANKLGLFLMIEAVK